jgi:type IV secretory pathway VirB10-like protein
MNREPKRWLDDESAPEGVRAILRGSQRALPIDAGARSRIGKRVARLSILPVTLLTWLGAKSALAALGAVAGIATMSVVTLATRGEPETPPSAPALRPVERAPKRVQLPRPPSSTPLPEVLPPPAPTVPPPSRSTASFPNVADEPARAAGLAEETEFLERARRLLKTDPAFALLFVREHGTRFPRGKLGAERSLIEIEALYRSGRHAEGRALAEQKLAASTGDLYSERLRTLLTRMDESR